MALTDLRVRTAKATGKIYTLGDYDGLSLFVSTRGGKAWHFRYYWLGKQLRISLGTYPEVGLRDARALRDEARGLIAKGVNPKIHRDQKRQAAKLAGECTFLVVYEQWLARRELVLEYGRQRTLEQIQRAFKKDVLPVLRRMTIYEITRHHLLEVIGRIEKRGALSVAEKVRTWFRQLFEYAFVVVPGMERNPATDLHVVAAPLPPVQHNPFLRMGELPSFLRTLRAYHGRLTTQLAIRLLLLTGVRTGELRLATPGQFDLERGLWIIPVMSLKQRAMLIRRRRSRVEDIPPYVVPLSSQAQELVRFMLKKFRPAQKYLFASATRLAGRMSENTVNFALKRMGYHGLLTGHGLRATMSTALNEIGYPRVWVDAQLSHADPNQIRATYNHAQYVEQRRVMMQDWADGVDLLERGEVEATGRGLVVQVNGMALPRRWDKNLSMAVSRDLPSYFSVKPHFSMC